MIPEANLAQLDVLNVGEGDMKFTFDTADPQDVARAESVVTDMLRRGYALFVEVDGKLHRIRDFNPKTACYVIATGPGVAVDHEGPAHAPGDPDDIATPEEIKAGVAQVAKKRGRPKKAEVPMKGAKVTSVPRTAGG